MMSTVKIEYGKNEDEVILNLPDDVWKNLENNDWRVGDDLDFESRRKQIKIINLSRLKRIAGTKI